MRTAAGSTTTTLGDFMAMNGDKPDDAKIEQITTTVTRSKTYPSGGGRLDGFGSIAG